LATDNVGRQVEPAADIREQYYLCKYTKWKQTRHVGVRR